MKDLFDVQQLTQFEFGAIVISVLTAGLVFGCLIAYGILNRKNSPKAVAAEKVREEFEEYKEKVDSHFNKTSEMFKDVTTQYKKLYDHMAVGAIELSNADTISMPRLEMQEDENQDDSQQPEQTDEVDDIADSSQQEQTDTDIEQASRQADQQSEQTADDMDNSTAVDNEAEDNDKPVEQSESDKIS